MRAGVPVVYMPLHKSHIDYTLLTFLAFHYNLPIMHVASGENLNLNGLGWCRVQGVMTMQMVAQTIGRLLHPPSIGGRLDDG